MKLSKLKITDSCTSVSWLPNHESVLLAGTHNGWLKIFDVRAGSSPCLTAHAHPFHKPRKVKGVRPNFFESSIVATFSDGQGDVVKVWDLRQVDKSKKTLSACYQINPHLANFPYTLNNSSKVGVVNDCSWSPIRTFSLAVSTSINPTISLFHCDMNKFDNSFEVNSNGHYATTNQPVNIVDAVDVVKSLSWCCASKLEPSRTFIDFGLSHVQDVPAITEPFFLSKSSTIDNQDQSLDKGRSIFDFQFDTKHNNNRLLAATINGLFDTDFRENSPFSLQGNIVLQSLSTSVVVRNNVLKLSNEYSDMKIINYLEDTALVQKHRASAGYSMDASINLDVLIDELDMVFKSLLRYNHDGRSEVVKCIFDLYKVWQWIDRYEVSNNLSRVSLRDCGVAKLFEDTENSNSGTALQGASTAAIHAATGAIHHYSIRRKIIKELCGWVDIPIQYQSSTSQLSSYGSEKSLSDDEDEPGNFTEDDGVYFEDDDMDETNISGGKKYQRNEDELYFEQKELLNILIEECLHDSFERAAVIALWHGELDLAVQILYNAIEEYSSRNKKIDKPLNQYESDINEELDEPKSVWDVPVTEEYMQLVTMVATCFAGYFVPFQMGNPSYKQKPKAIDRISWKTMCHHIILQLQNNIRKSAAYLLAGCQFLLMNYESSQEEYCSQLQHNTQGGKDQGYLYINENERSTLGLYSSILGNRDISIEDQISFASIYLQDEDFKQWAKEKQLYCMNEGLLQGLLFTGLLTKDGFEVLQSYVDKTNDIQSVALLSSRLFYHISDLDSNSSSKDSGQVQIKDCNDMELLLQSCKNWLFYYRSLLNEWELFTERAYLDLEIHQRLQKKKDTAQSTIKTSVPNNNSQNSRQQVLVKRPGGGSASGSVGVPLLCKPVFEDIFHSLRVPVCSSSSSKTIVNHPLYFSYIKLKCSFCGMALPLDDISMKKMDQLRSQKNILNCCPHCSKPLPRCYICQLQLVSPIYHFSFLN